MHISKVKSIFALMRTRTFWVAVGHFLIKLPPTTARVIILFTTFFVILIFFMLIKIAELMSRIPGIHAIFIRVHPALRSRGFPSADDIMKKLESIRPFKVRRSYLIFIAYQNLLSRKSRSLVTIMGMSIGVGVIVYLLSLGYGIERLVIKQVASLDELRMIDVAAGETTTQKINAAVMKRIKKIKSVGQVIPMISVVGRVNYLNAKTDMLVYAVPLDYMKLSRLSVIKGSLFVRNNLEDYSASFTGQVAGAADKEVIGRIDTPVTGETAQFNFAPDKAVPVWESCSITAKIAGYTARTIGNFSGKEYWGGEYAPFTPYGRGAYDPKISGYVGKWMKSKVPLYTKGVDEILTPLLDDQGRQKYEEGCMQSKFVIVEDRYSVSEVLGVATSSAQFSEVGLENDVLAATDSAVPAYDTEVVSTNSAGLEVVRLSSQTDTATKVSRDKTIPFSDSPSGTAVVSTGFIKLLNIPINRAVGTKFKTSFIVVQSIMPQVSGRALTEEVEYTIQGVVDDIDKQYFYIPFGDMQKLGVSNFSQLKTVLDSQKTIATVRKEIETMGFNTSSAVDTVAQIESFFANLRVILGLIGLIALAVASLGMFNTLTVSLLERTREIGGMKTIGMVSDEIQDLFLAEAMIMGFGGGIGGLLMGYLAGKITSLVVSVIAFTNGAGIMNLTYIPTYLIVFILGCSFVVGVITGLYPAQRARRISALNALRYE